MFTEIIFQRIADFILEGGYFFIFLAMFLEGIIFPLPSEAVLGFVGFLTAQKEFSFLLALLSSVAGSYLCALCYYLIGYFGFKPFVLKYGKYLLLKKEDVEKTDRFFERYGQKAIFLSRFVPVVRELGALPAGGAKMKIGKFSLVTILGATIWNSIFIILGIILRDNWHTIEKISAKFDYLTIAIIFIAVVYFAHKRRKTLLRLLYKIQKKSKKAS